MLGKLIVACPAAARLRDDVRDALRVTNLAGIHNLEHYGQLERATDQKTRWHKAFYAACAHGEIDFAPLIAFARRVVGEPIVYQRVPTFRVCFPGNVGVGEFHRDRDYNHGRDEINFWLPLTDVHAENSVWIESAEGREDFTPTPMKFGEILIFDGANLKHGNSGGDCGLTRVSFDFRVVPRRLFVPRADATINTGMRFDAAPGGYFAAWPEPVENLEALRTDWRELVADPPAGAMR